MNNDGAESTRPIRKRIPAGMLALFFGFLGAHRWYLGDRWWFVYPLLCWTGLPTLVGFVEAIVFMVSDQKTWDERHNPGMATPVEGMTSAYIAVAMVALVALTLFGGIVVVGLRIVTAPPGV